MEQWEIDLRAKLEKELPEGFYQIGPFGENGFIVHTGKKGKIEFDVQFAKEANNFTYTGGIREQMEKEGTAFYSELGITKSDLDEFLKNLYLK